MGTVRIARLAFVAAVVLVLTPEVARADTGTTPAFLRTLGGPSHAQGRIAVADTLNHRVVLLHANGSQLGVITTPAMDDPESVAFGPDGRLYVSDTYNDRVLVFAALG